MAEAANPEPAKTGVARTETAKTPPVEPERKSSLLWWLLALLGTGVAILGLGTFIVWRVIAPEVQVIRTAGGVEIQTPVGNLKASREGDDTGLPKYPGAELTEPGATVEVESPAEDNVSITVAKYRSADSIDKVDAWYKERLGPEFEREGGGKMERKRVIYGTDVSSDDVAFLQDRERLLQVVVLRRKGLATEIVLLRAGEPDAK